ncbi:MAG: MotA/TolQ/ExbB proton channel family protein [Bacteroidales bacterium]|nr:MotA/TolQ/ExbB proton channel family protein [Bacteroidales bacterium]MCF8389395.1 MotA/TolQ/ExbB proton channel family protein [Bacteroidales bacterium]
MFNLFQTGGPLFMGILTLMLFIILALFFYYLYLIIKLEYKDLDQTLKRLSFLKTGGVIALVTGFLGQMVGLHYAFTAIEAAGDVSPSILAGGLKVSMIAPIYGLLIFLISYLLWTILYFSGTKIRD